VSNKKAQKCHKTINRVSRAFEKNYCVYEIEKEHIFITTE